MLPTQNNGRRIGDYTLIRCLGEGGMGTVWLAEHAILGRRAAIKLLHESFAQRADIVTRFFNEARAASAISDHGIVQIFDFGRDAYGTVYIVMELLEGEPLDERLRRHGALPAQVALRLVRQVASSLGAAHARGIVHRDLKPENIFIVRDPEVAGGERTKLLDFGIAKLADQAGVKTVTQALMGTPTFMSPEQCRGAGHVDQRSDIYALGCVLFMLLTGRPPFDAEGPGDIIAMHLREPPPRLHAMPRELDELVARCLEKDPQRRFSSGMALAAAIEAALEAMVARPHASHVTPSASAIPLQSSPTTLSTSAAEVAGPRRTRVRGIGLIAIAALAAGALVTVARRDEPVVAIEPAAAPAPPASAAATTVSRPTTERAGVAPATMATSPAAATDRDIAAPGAAATVPGATTERAGAAPATTATSPAAMPDRAVTSPAAVTTDRAVTSPAATDQADAAPDPAAAPAVRAAEVDPPRTGEPPRTAKPKHRPKSRPAVVPTAIPAAPPPKKPKCDLDGDGVPDDWSCS